MARPRPSRPATAPITAGRARGLVVFGALVLVGLGVGVGRYAAQRSLFGFDGAAWSTEAVVVRVSDGSDATAALAVAFALALSALAAWGLWRIVRSHLDPRPPQRRSWIWAIGAMWVSGAVATVGGFVATARDDGVGGGWVAGNLLDAGDDVAAELTSGYVERPQPGGAGVSRSIRLPAVIEYEVDGQGCTIVVDDRVDVDDDTITLTPRCSPFPGSARPGAGGEPTRVGAKNPARPIGDVVIGSSHGSTAGGAPGRHRCLGERHAAPAAHPVRAPDGRAV